MARLRMWKGFSILVALALVLALGIVAVPMAGASADNGGKGSFDILVFEDDDWQLQGELSFSDYETRELPLDNDAGQVSIRLVQHGHDGAYVDYVALQKDSATYLPARAINIDSNTNILDKIISPEYDVCAAWSSALEIVWDNVPANTALVMRAMEEDLGIGHGGPLYYPNIHRGETLSYALVNDGSIIVDGVLEETTEPAFSVFWQPDSPHPDGYTYGWLHCDEDYLYAAVEVTADNTPDEEDWGALYVVVDGELKEFRISCDDNQWGTNGFHYTPSVIYEHRIYEFQIPLSEITAHIGDEIYYGFGCYGTVFVYYEVWVDDDWNSQADVDLFNPSLTWQTNAFNKTQDGIYAVHEDGTVHVRAGDYDEHLVIEDKSLTLQSTDGWQDTTIDPMGDSIIRIEGDADVTVQGFEITAGSWGIYIGEVFSTVYVLDCFIHDNLADGIRVVSGGDLLHIEGNIISQNGVADSECGIHIYEAWNTTNILHNIIGAWWDGEDVGTTYAGNNGDGIRIDDVPVESAVTIEDNFIVDNGDDGIDFSSPTSVHGSVNIEDNVIGAWVYVYGGGSAVRFGGNENRGIHVAHVSDTGRINIEGNAISENGEDGINFGSGVSPIFGEVTILGNLIGAWTCYAGDYGYSGSPQRYYGNWDRGIEINQVGQSGASGTVTIEGNKISENHRGAVDETGIYIGNIYGVVTIEGNDIGSWTDRHGASYLGNNGAGILIANVYSGAELTIGPDNSIKNNLGHGIDILWGQASSDIEIHHNVIDHNGFWDLDRGIKQDSGGVCGIKLGSGGVCGAMVNDNIITNHHEGVHLDENSRNTIVQNNEIRDNAEGIWIEGDNNQILRNNILNNKGAPASGIHLTSTAEGNIIHCNNIVGNLPYGIYNENPDEAVGATGNWWGDAFGPYHETLNPSGLGNEVSGNVTFDPWLPTQFQYCRECGGAPPSPAVPTVNHWGIVAMITLFAALLVWRMRRRQVISLKR